MSSFESSVLGQLNDLATRVSMLEGRVTLVEGTRPRVAPTMPADAAVELPRVPVREAPPPRPLTPIEPSSGAESDLARRVERQIGGRVFAAVGAVTLVISAGLFLKLAYDQGWIGRIPPAGRCLIGVLGGAALLGLGEWLRRRINALAAAGAFAAGLGTMYASAFAAHGLYGLVGPSAAIAMLSGCVVMGLFIGARAGLASVACVSLIGGYIAPLLLHEAEPSPSFLPSYLLALQVIACVLVAWRGRAVRLLFLARLIALMGTFIFGTVWIYVHSGDHPWLVAAFAGLSWGLLHADLIACARRDIRECTLSAWSRQASDALQSMGATAWACTAILFALGQGTKVEAWIPLLIATCVVLGLALVVWKKFGAVRSLKALAHADGLKVSLLVQGAVLVVTTLAAALAGTTLVLAWMSLAAAAVAAGRWLRIAWLDRYGIVCLSLASVAHFGQDARFEAREIASGWLMSAWNWWMLALGLLWLGVARATCVREVGGIVARAAIAAWVALCMLLAAGHQPDSSRFALTVWMSLVIAVGAWLLRWYRGSLLELPAMGAAGLGGLLWMVWFTLETRWSTIDGWALAHPGLGAMLALVVSIAMLGWRSYATCRNAAVNDRDTLRFVTAISILLGMSLFFIGTSYEVARSAARLLNDPTVRQAALSVYWGVFASGLLAVGLASTRAWLRYAGLGLMSVAALKVLLVDLSAVSAVWRILSTLGVGGLMLGVAVVYSKLSSSPNASAESKESTRDLSLDPARRE